MPAGGIGGARAVRRHIRHRHTRHRHHRRSSRPAPARGCRSRTCIAGSRSRSGAGCRRPSLAPHRRRPRCPRAARARADGRTRAAVERRAGRRTQRGADGRAADRARGRRRAHAARLLERVLTAVRIVGAELVERLARAGQRHHARPGRHVRACAEQAGQRQRAGTRSGRNTDFIVAPPSLRPRRHRSPAGLAGLYIRVVMLRRVAVVPEVRVAFVLRLPLLDVLGRRPRIDGHGDDRRRVVVRRGYDG